MRAGDDKLTVYQKRTISTNIFQMDTNILAPIMGDIDGKEGSSNMMERNDDITW